MKIAKKLIVLFTALILMTVLCACSDNGVKFKTTDFDGNAKDESMLKGYDMTIVYLWEPWCEPCIKELSELEKVYEQNKDNGVMVIGVSGGMLNGDDENYDAHQVAEDAGVTFPLLNYSNEFMQYDTTNFRPTAFILNKKREIIPVRENLLYEPFAKPYREIADGYAQGLYDAYAEEPSLADYVEHLRQLAEDESYFKSYVSKELELSLGKSGEFSVSLSYEDWQKLLEVLK